MDKCKLLAVGLNPVVQKTLRFPELWLGKVNRAKSIFHSPGGKGTHCARAANLLAPGSCTLAYFSGGSGGQSFSRQLVELGIPGIQVRIPEETRGCTTILDCESGVTTELVEPSPMVPADAEDLMREELAVFLPDVDGIALCGTVPPGLDGDIYAWIAQRKGDALLLLDGYRDVANVLETGAVDVLKINCEEACDLAGTSTIEAAASQLLAGRKLRWLAATDGPKRAVLYGQDEAWQYELPVLENLVNPIGAGDTASGVTLVRAAHGMHVRDAFAWGLAAASASCLRVAGADFSVADMEEIHAGIKRREL